MIIVLWSLLLDAFLVKLLRKSVEKGEDPSDGAFGPLMVLLVCVCVCVSPIRRRFAIEHFRYYYFFLRTVLVIFLTRLTY